MTDLTRVTSWLAQIPALAALAGCFLTPGTPRESEARRTAPGSRPPIDLGVLDLIEGRELWNWIHLVADERNTPRPTGLTLTQACEWLSARTGWILEYHDDYAHEIHKLHDRYRDAAREPASRPWPCPDCKWNLEAKGDPDGKGTHPLHLCNGCGRVWRQKELEDRLDKHERANLKSAENAVPIRYAAQHVGRPVATLKLWVKEGLLESLGFDRQRNCALYPLDHVIQLSDEKATRARKSA